MKHAATSWRTVSAKPVRIPSQEIKVLGGFTVGENDLTTFELDFDARASLLRLGHGGWLMRPVVVNSGNNKSSRP